MKPLISLIAPGAMGAGIGQCLTQHGLEVRTLLEGRSAASQERSNAAGLISTDLNGLAEGDILLSIMPPGDALTLASKLAPELARRNPRLVYADLNAVSPQTALEIEAVVHRAGLKFADGGIIGTPPKNGSTPAIYVSGEAAPALTVLNDYGLNIKPITGPAGAASGMKMSYAGITKGTTAIVSLMILGATKFGADAELRREFAASQPGIFKRSEKAVPEMFSKAYRWVAEMREIADFLGKDDPGYQVFNGIAELYEKLAKDFAGDKSDIGKLAAFIGTPSD